MSQDFMNCMNNQLNRLRTFANRNEYPAFINYNNDNDIEHVFDAMFMGKLTEEHTTSGGVNSNVQQVPGIVQIFADTISGDKSYDTFEEFSFASFKEVHHFNSDEIVDNDYILIENGYISEDSIETIASIVPELEEQIIYKSSLDEKLTCESMPGLIERAQEDASSDKENEGSRKSVSKKKRYLSP